MNESSMENNKIMEAYDGANAYSINFSQAASLLVAYHAIIMLVQSGVANKRFCKYFIVAFNITSEMNVPPRMPMFPTKRDFKD